MRNTLLGWGAITLLVLVACAPMTDAGPDRPIQAAAIDAGGAEREATGAIGSPISAPSGSFAGDAVRTVVALGAVLALALVMRQVARRFADPLAARRPSGVVQILSRFPVGKGQSVQLLGVGTRVLCVHQAAGRMSTLCEFTDPQEIALLRTRIEAGTAGREQFEGELVRSLERDRDTARVGRGGQTMPAPTETVDLTKRRAGNSRQSRLSLVGGGRG
jgi:flagellar biogenesis protein FliO